MREVIEDTNLHSPDFTHNSVEPLPARRVEYLECSSKPVEQSNIRPRHAAEYLEVRPGVLMQSCDDIGVSCIEVK